MKKILIIATIFLITLAGCSRSIKPVKVIEQAFDLHEAEVIMKRTWQPIHDLTNANDETGADRPMSSKEEFFDTYDFLYMDDAIKYSLYETIVDRVDHDEEARDSDGNIVFGEGSLKTYVPTIYDEGVFIDKVYVKESIYKEEYSFMNKTELIIKENSNKKINGYAEGFSRNNVFRKNREDEWILTQINGTVSISWDRK